MTLHERRAATRAALLANPARSDRMIARSLEVTREMVSDVRADLVASGVIEAVARKGQDGKVYTKTPPGRTQSRVDRLVRRLAMIASAIREPEFFDAWRQSPDTSRKRLSVAAFEISSEAAKLRKQA